MRIQKINNVQINYSKNNNKKITKVQTQPAFRGVQDIESEYDQKIKNLGWWKRNFTNAEEDLKIQKNAAILGYAKAQEEARQEIMKIYNQRIKDMQDAQKNNAPAEIILEKQLEVQKAQDLLKVQEELMKVKDNHGWDRIAGYDSEKQILSSEFIQAVGLEKAGHEVSVPNGILFFGPTGNGKTTFAKAFAEQSQCNLIEIDAMSKKDFENDLNNALKESQKLYNKDKTRTIILLDEFEKYGLASEKGGDKVLIATLKNIMQNSANRYKATLFLTTNNPQDIDPILLVDSRASVRVFLDPPNKENAVKVFEHYLKGKTTNNINYENLVNELFKNQGNEAYSNSRIKAISESCFKEAMATKRLLTEGDLIEKIKTTLPDIKKAHLEKYKADVKAIVGIIK